MVILDTAAAPDSMGWWRHSNRTELKVPGAVAQLPLDRLSTDLFHHCGALRPDPGGKAFPDNRVVDFVLAQQARMPDYLRLPMIAATLFFDFSTLARARRRFHRLGHAERWRQIVNWKNSSLSAHRNFIKFYESLATFGWYAELEGAAVD
jgi:hypothetical protein